MFIKEARLYSIYGEARESIYFIPVLPLGYVYSVRECQGGKTPGIVQTGSFAVCTIPRKTVARFSCIFLGTPKSTV